MIHLRSILARLIPGRGQGTLSLPVNATSSLAGGVTRNGRKSDLMLKIEAAGARPGETVAIDEQGHARVLGRKPEVAVDNTK